MASHPPFTGDNLSELLRQEKLKNERQTFQIRAFESSSETWAAEKRDLNEALRAKLDENNVLHTALKQEELKLAFIFEELSAKTIKLQAYMDSHANAPSSPLQSRDMMVSDIAPEMKLTIMETINGMSHELLIDFYNENVAQPSTPEVAAPETATAALKRPSDKVHKSKPTA